MKVASRVLLIGAAIALVSGLVLGTIPVRVRPVIAPPPAGQETVSCGTAFSETEWTNDDACEGPLIGQRGVIFAAFGLCVVCFVLGAGALALSMSRELRYRRV